MKIGFDLDGVIANFTDSYAAILTKQTGIKFPKNSASWPTVWYWDRAAGITKAQEKAAWDEITNTAFWAELPILPEGRETLGELQALRFAGHQIYFITSRPGRFAKLLTEQWLRDHGFPGATVLIADKKGPLADGLQLDVFVDDKPENCEDVFNARLTRKSMTSSDGTEIVTVDEPKCRVFLVNAPYNRNHIMDARIERVDSGLEALEILQEKNLAKAA